MTIEIHKPELETLIRERMESGGYENVELGEFLMESPLWGSGLVVEREKDTPRPVDL